MQLGGMPTLRRLTLALSGWLLTGGACVATETAAHAYHIPSGTLDDSLRDFEVQSGTHVLRASGLTARLPSAGLSGSYQASQALHRLLLGSGLDAVEVAADTYVLKAAPVERPAAAPAQPKAARSSSLPTNLAQVDVTGMHVRLSDLETAQPVVTITQADIQKSGLVTVGDILQDLTIAGQPTFSKASVLASNTEEGGQYINLYNLGENRVLVLVNGKRWMTSLAGFTDLSTIPSSLIDHIDVLKDGASAVYGSDAVAGVVNIILKDHYNGAEFSGYVGQNQQGDGTQQAYSLTVGSTDDKSSVVFSASYDKTDPVWADQRAITNYTFGPAHKLQGLNSNGPWGSFISLDDPSGTRYTLNHTGGWNGIGVGEDATRLSSYHVGVNDPGDYYNTSQQMMAQLGSELKSIFTRASYRLNDDVTFRAIGMYSERISTAQSSGYPLNSQSQPGFPVYISGQDYYNPEPGQPLYFFRRIVELPRVATESAKSYHFDASLDGAFEVGSHSWSWDTGFDYNKYDVSSVGTGNINLFNLQNALGPSFLNSMGVVQCGTATEPVIRCVPFNILGGPNASTAAALNYINALEQANQESLTKDYTANITGGLFDMPWGAGTLSFATGYEHRQISGYDRLDELTSAGYTTDLTANPTVGNYHTDEVYVEFNLPLLKDLPGARELSFDVASRYSHYSNFGSTTNDKYSFLWKPIDDLIVRGTFAHGFRAPTLADTFGGGSQSFDYYTDPCDAVYGNPGNAAVAKACQAAGLPATFRQTDSAGHPVDSSDSQSTTPFYTGYGNAKLQPEHSLGRTVGLVYSPAYVPGLGFTLDYYKILVRNVITAISADYVLDQCYQYSVQFYCNSFSRDPATGQVVGLERGNANLGSLDTSGFTFGVNYHLPAFAFGKFTATFDANYLKNYIQTSQPGAAGQDFAGQFGFPHFRVNLGLDWQLGDWGATWGLRYYGKYKDICEFGVCSDPDYSNASWAYGGGANRKGAIVYNDAQLRYQLPWNGSISVGARDIFDKHPPVEFESTGASTGRIDPTLDLGRYFYLQYFQKF